MLHVLLLDDDPFFCDLLATALQRQHELEINVKTTTRSEDARQAIYDAEEPFDVFLIDLRLGPGPNGITIMQELRQLSPTSGAIILTGRDDSSIGLQAYQAGAHSYLPKPFQPLELIWILQAFEKARNVQRERELLKVLTGLAEEVSRALRVQHVAETITYGSQRLGFERARLWRVSSDGKALIGVSQVGNLGLDDFNGLIMPIEESPYAQYVKNHHKPVRLSRQVLGPGFVDRLRESQGFVPPQGELIYIPLWINDRFWGLLTLDNVVQRLAIQPEQEHLLELFGRQAAGALERAELYEREARRKDELEVLHQIGKRVIARAALDDLPALLRELQIQLSKLMEIDGFEVALLDKESGKVYNQLLGKDGTPESVRWLAQNEGLISHVITADKQLFLPHGTREYREKHGIKLIGTRAQAWMGLPLHIEGQAIGALAVEHYTRPGAYSSDDWKIFLAVADQIAGVIQAVRIKDQEEAEHNQLATLHRATQVLMELAEQNEDMLWHATLTVATANYALGFNRAILFVAEEGGKYLHGQLGVGHLDRDMAMHDWERDKATELNIDKYLELLRAGSYNRTKLESESYGWKLDLEGDSGAFTDVLRTGMLQMVLADEAERRLPAEFINRLGITHYAVLPLQIGSMVLGLVVVDNIHDQKPLSKSSLKHLELVLRQTALILENLRQRNAKDQLIELNYLVMNQQGSKTLHQTLTKVCETARAVTGADYIVIYPLKQHKTPPEYEIKHIASSGQEQNSPPNPPRRAGLTMSILQSGTHVISDVLQHSTVYHGQRLEEFGFIQNERIRALIGCPLRDKITNEPLGVMYINYRTPKSFGVQDIRKAETFASQAAMIIHNTRLMHGAATATQAREKELKILRGVLLHALKINPGHRDSIITSLLNAVHELIEQPEIRVQLILRAWEHIQPSSEPSEVRHQYYLGSDAKLGKHTVAHVFRGISGRAIETGISQRAVDVDEHHWRKYYYSDGPSSTRSELDVPIKLGEQVIGAFNIESPALGTFTEIDQAMIERLAAAAALALDNERRQSRLQNVLEAARAVTTPTDVLTTLNSIKSATRSAMPNLSALIIWYKAPETRQLVLGPYFGVYHENELARTNPNVEPIIQHVTNADKPTWSDNARAHGSIYGAFIEREQIVSVAALPLRADDEMIGVMFFNYRHHHEFSVEERSLLSLFAEIAAASIRDAARLEETRRQAKRLRFAHEITEAVGTTLDLHQALRKIMRRLVELFPDTQPCVLTYNETEDVLIFTPASQEFYQIDHSDYQISARIPVKTGPSIASWLSLKSLRSHQVEIHIANDVSKDDHYLGLNRTTQSEVCVTLMDGDHLLGILALESFTLNAFDQEVEDLIRSVGQQISLVLARAKQGADLRFNITVAAATAWAAEIAHDINREVGYIRRHVYRLQRMDGFSEAGRIHTRQIDASAARLAGTLQEADPRNPQNPELLLLDQHLQQWITEMVEKRRPDIRLDWALVCDAIYIQAHIDTLKRVMRHLVRNALEAMSGPGTITVQTQRIGEQWIEVLFMDNGPHIPATMQQTIFQEPKSNKGKWRGYGLLFVRHAIENMGGTVRYVPSDVGAAFAITLPIAGYKEEAPYEAARG